MLIFYLYKILKEDDWNTIMIWYQAFIKSIMNFTDWDKIYTINELKIKKIIKIQKLLIIII